MIYDYVQTDLTGYGGGLDVKRRLIRLENPEAFSGL
jgi:O6-methylguanine-DNA--protein-cysteine methyltransferase